MQLLEAVARQGGAQCLPVAADVTQPESVAALFAKAVAVCGRVDLLFNNAGTSGKAAPLEELDIAQWRSVIDTNLTGAFLCTQAAFRVMQAQTPRGGRIINNGSIAATAPRPWLAAYSASKAGITALTKSSSLEGRPHDIACGQIDIGNTATSLVSGFTQGTLQADLSVKAEPTFNVKHVADAVLYMANLPLDANVLFMTVMATKMPFVGLGKPPSGLAICQLQLLDALLGVFTHFVARFVRVQDLFGLMDFAANRRQAAVYAVDFVTELEGAHEISLI
jgi:NAD(P)-dependent dehydrogenase (short-subunit alcohol dehydrogenase family)